MLYCIETQPFWPQNGFCFPLPPFPNPDLYNWTLIAKRAIFLCLENHPFTFCIAETGLYYKIALIQDSNTDIVLPVRLPQASLTPAEVQAQMEALYVWANSFL